MASRALTTPVSLLKLLRSHLNPSVASLHSVRSIRSFSKYSDSDSETETDESSDSDSEADTRAKKNIRKVCPLYNRFMKQGSPIPYKVKGDDNAMYARLDMPGVGKDGVKLWVENSSLEIRGDEMEEKGDLSALDKEQPPRKYSGNIEVREGRYKLEEIEAELKKGVLRLRIPKVKMEERSDVIEVNVK